MLPVLVALLGRCLAGRAAGPRVVVGGRGGTRGGSRATRWGSIHARPPARTSRRRFERGLRVREARRGGEVTVTVRVPSVIGGGRVGRVSATSAFAAQR